jgi:hypothetical protein
MLYETKQLPDKNGILRDRKVLTGAGFEVARGAAIQHGAKFSMDYISGSYDDSPGKVFMTVFFTEPGKECARYIHPRYMGVYHLEYSISWDDENLATLEEPKNLS